MANGALFFNGFDIGNVRVPLLRIVIILSAFALIVVLLRLLVETGRGPARR